MQIKALKFLLSFIVILAIIWITNCNSLPALATNYFPALTTTEETRSITKLGEPVALQENSINLGNLNKARTARSNCCPDVKSGQACERIDFGTNIKPLAAQICTDSSLAIEYLSTEPIPTPTQEQLLKLSIHLRDAARYLGASLPVTVTLYEPPGNSWRFTDIKGSNGWTTLTVGQALKLVTQELRVLKAREIQPVIALLLKDEDELADRYLSVRIPLNLYCYKLSKLIKLPAT